MSLYIYNELRCIIWSCYLSTITDTNDPDKENTSSELNNASLLIAEPTTTPSLPLELSDLLGDDPNNTKEISINFLPELKVRWEKWVKEGLPSESKKTIVEKYPRKGDIYVEAPKINLEVIPILSEIAKKRDGHFVDTQNTVGSAISSLGAAISLIMTNPEEVDLGTLTEYLCDAGMLLTDTFYQHSIARRSFITPLLNKSLKPTVEATKPDEWLYGSKFADQVKEAKTIEKACSTIKASEKLPRNNTPYPRNQGNARAPPAAYKQGGQASRRPMLKFKPKNTYLNQRTSKNSSSSKTPTKKT